MSDLYRPRKTTMDDWLASYNTAKLLMGYPFDIHLTFESKRGRSPISGSIPMGRTSMAIYIPKINIDPDLAFGLTSRNLRLLSMSHEIVETRVSLDPISLLLRIRGLLNSPRNAREKYVNRIVYGIFIKKFGEQEATERFYRFVSEWIGLISKSGSEITVNSYIEDCMPFINV